ncbi:MAG: DUF885 domain-containing protein [Lachnospiraceae bacterium]|nr:DUF885 domain-containing protein [Lachnospiraceae bacterium]
MNKKAIIFVSSVTILAICFVFYYVTNPISRNAYRAKTLKAVYSAETFSDFANNLFCYEVSTNSATTAYTLKAPETYQIPENEPLLTDFSVKDYKKDSIKKKSKKTTKHLENKLNSFSKDNLSEKELITYDLLKKHLSLSEKFSDYSYYETLLGSTTGVASTLPVTLCEYPINDTDDIDTYLELLTQVPEYFNEAIKYENERIKKDMATPDFILIDTEKELSKIIKSLKSDDNFLVVTFENRLNEIKGLNKTDRKKYISKNRYYVNQCILPAYKSIHACVEKLILSKSTKSPIAPVNSRSLCKNAGKLPDADTSYGLASFEKGKDYYTLLVYDKTGSSSSVTDMISTCENAINDSLSGVLKIATTDADAYMYYCDHPAITNYHTPEGILEALNLFIRDEYPPLDKAITYDIKTVPKSLESFTSPAFYMIPQIDNYSDNTIYINPLYTNEENGNLFTTLAHEGFPGHLYQTVYYNNTSPAPIRQILDYPGYVEGWATYVELNAFSYINYPKYSESLQQLYRYDTIINLALSSRIDIGVNYEGWTLNDTCNYFNELGFNSYYAPDIYSYVIEAPANYLSYFIGYNEINNLKDQYKNCKMENYTDMDFHKALLDIGPADFETIRKYILKN